MRVSGLDHLVYATPDLDRTVDELARHLGVRASAGGQHPGRGTHNALIALGPRSYLEIVGPDSSQPRPATSRWFGIDMLSRPRLVAWAASAQDLVTLSSNAASQGVRLGAVTAGARMRPDGVHLNWQMTDPTVVVGDGLVPFLIDWGASPHPAESAARDVDVIEFRGEHPEAAEIRRRLEALGIDLPVDPAPAARLIASLRGPRGELLLD